MNTGARPKILELGKGEHEQKMLKVVLESEYKGPVGILDHQNELDAEKSLQANLAGLDSLPVSYTHLTLPTNLCV